MILTFVKDRGKLERIVVQIKAGCEIIARAYGTIGELFLLACGGKDVV